MGADLLSAVALNDAPERIRGWSLMCGFQEPNFRDWSDFAKFVDDRAGSAAKHLRRVRKGRGAAVLPKVRRKKAKLVCDLAHTRSEPGLHAVLWVDGAPKCDFSQPARPQSQPAPQVQVIGQQQELDRPGTCPPSTGSKGSLGGKEKRLAKLSPLPTNHSPRHRRLGSRAEAADFSW
ncbi:unnamed protein product [Effrenium voratum]|nr:unnamed protein product [Effrenium voratum]